MRPFSLRTPDIFGFLGLLHRVKLLRNLRSIELNVVIEGADMWSEKRILARLELFTDTLKRFADRDDKKSLFQSFKVKVIVRRGGDREDEDPASNRWNEDTHDILSELKSLATLQGIKCVDITDLPTWYAQCMMTCIQSTEKMESLQWPKVKVKRLHPGPGGWNNVSMRKWWQAKLDWEEFAGRHGIDVPGHMDKYLEIGDWAALEYGSVGNSRDCSVD